MKQKHPLLPKATWKVAWNQWSVGVAWIRLWTWETKARRYTEAYVFLGPLILTFQSNPKG